MKKFAKRFAAAALVLMMTIGALTGCGQQAGEQSQTLLFTYDGREVYLDEAWTYAKIAQATYEASYALMLGEDMWTMQVSVDEAGNPVDFQQMVKGSVISQIKQIIILVNNAEEPVVLRIRQRLVGRSVVTVGDLFVTLKGKIIGFHCCHLLLQSINVLGNGARIAFVICLCKTKYKLEYRCLSCFIFRYVLVNVLYSFFLNFGS